MTDLSQALKKKRNAEEIKRLNEKFGYSNDFKGELKIVGNTVKTLLTGGSPATPLKPKIQKEKLWQKK